jgi:hypothetical protein
MPTARDAISDSLLIEFRRTVPGLSEAAERQLVRKLAAWRSLKPSVAELEASGIGPTHPDFGQKIKDLTNEFRQWLGPYYEASPVDAAG